MTAEAAVCGAAVIMLFSLFITIAGYCRAYADVKEYADEKAREVSLVCHTAGMSFPGIIPAAGYQNPGQVKNLFLCHESWGEETHINVSYTYASLLGDFRVSMNSVFTKWEGDAPQDFESVWKLPPNERGRKIEEIFGGGLPEFFPVLDAYDPVTGHAAAIVSMDTTLGKYESGSMIREVLHGKIDELASFDYGKSGETVITAMDIDSRELIVVLPENPLEPIQQEVLDECCIYASGREIGLRIKRYQTAGPVAGPVSGDIE